MQFTLAQLATKVEGVVVGEADKLILRLGTLESADVDALSFLANPKYTRLLSHTRAGAVLVKSQQQAQLVANAIIVANPYLAFAQLTQLFDQRQNTWHGIHPSAVIDSQAVIGQGVTIGPNVVVEAHAVIADDVYLGPGCVVGQGVYIGPRTKLYANVTLYHRVEIGHDCVVHSGVVIGADGFGFAPSDDGWCKIAQLGSVIIGHGVEIGANTTIDRGALENTCIGNGVIIDNQVQIAHNVIIGDNTAIAGCAAIAGSTHIGKNCTIAGGVGIIGHLVIADGVHITAMSLVSKSIGQAGSYSSGTGLDTTEKWRRSAARLRRIDDMAKHIADLEQQINMLHKKVDAQ